MSLYAFTLTIPPNTAKTSPVEAEVGLSAGVVRRVAVGFPLNCAGLAHVVIRHALHQIWPANEGQDMAFDNFVLKWDDEFPLTAASARFTLTGWNDDDTYPHKISFWFNILDEALAERGQETLSFLRRLQKLLGL